MGKRKPVTHLDVTTPMCAHCGREETFRLPVEGYANWAMKGWPVWSAFPEMTYEQIHLLQTGEHWACKVDWDEIKAKLLTMTDEEF